MNKRSVLSVKGARQHNLKNISIDIPKGKLVVFTGVSGSGKSSLAFDTLYAEGQRRYVESLSAYARQFLGQMDKPLYDRISGLAPTIAIDQKTTGSNPRSTVGTITEIYDYLRVLYSRVGQQHCHRCGALVGSQQPSQIVDDMLSWSEGSRILVLAPIAKRRKGSFQETFQELKKKGYVRVQIDGEIHRLEDEVVLDKNRHHDVDLVVDRAVIRLRDRLRLTESIETALSEGQGHCQVLLLDEKREVKEARSYSESAHCSQCGLNFPALTPQRFSFNTPQGACVTCNGLGIATRADPKRLVPDPSLSVRQGAIAPWSKQVDNNSWTRHLLEAIERDFHIDLDTPWKDLRDSERKVLLYGTDRRVRVKLNGAKMKGEWAMNFEGALNQVERRWRETSSSQMRAHYAQYFVEQTCPSCKGRRIRPESAAVRVANRSLPELVNEPVEKLFIDLSTLKLPGNQGVIAEQLLKEITSRLKFLVDVGLGYLNLSRSGQSLSGGEAQRIRLASQIGSELTGVLYILDEPSIGLHPRDTERLLTTLQHLRDIGNSVLVVEHDADTICSADHVVDFGPQAGIHGGQVIAQGRVEDLIQCELSLTGQWLSGQRKMPARSALRPPTSHLKIIGAREHNLRGIDVDLPLGCLTVVTGVSGAGKSTLIKSIVVPALKNALHSTAHPIGAHDRIDGIDSIDKIIEVDQRPIGRTPRSNPATYTKVWDKIRALFAGLPDAKVAGYSAGRFSFNVKGGRCETCKGDGMLKIEMHFLADVYVPCEACGGRRFNDATLAVRYKGRSIADVMQCTVDEALELFANHRAIKRILQTLKRVGLGYLTLGQSAPTLSGGEAQRLKLARELAKSERGHTLYVLDEPTTGLHFEDVRRLLEVLNALVDRGASVLVIEHNLEVIAAADQIIDLGPEGGAAGGDIVAWGSPAQIQSHPQSHTGAALRKRAS